MLLPSQRRLTREAEGVGFEPTVGFPTLDFESSALNRTQPPFLDARKASNAKRQTSNVECNCVRHCVQRSTLGVHQAKTYAVRAQRGIRKRCRTRQGTGALLSAKMLQFYACHAFYRGCILYVRWRATLLLVVDRDSQLVSAAVHEYSQLIRNLNPPSPP